MPEIGSAMSLPEAARTFIVDSAPIAHLVTMDADGSPHVTMAWADVDGNGDLLIGTLFDQKKLRNVRRDPRVTVSFESTVTRPPGLREYLVVDGMARVEEGGAPELLRQLGKRHLGPDVDFPPMPDPPPGFVTRITPTSVRGIGPWSD
jgi:PPOX class probable F420-dependent enzyme